LDDELRPQALYYTGLSQAHLQDFPAAAGAFAAVEQSPLSPLSDSARNLAKQVAPGGEPAQRWSLAVTAGLEYDSNPTLAGRGLKSRKDGRGVYRIRGTYLLYEDERYSATAGYDGYLSSHFDETFVDLMTHVGHLTTSADFDPVSFNLRYDYAYTWIDAFNTRKFRELHRVTPSVSYRESDWGFSQVYYQFHEEDFKRPLPVLTGNTLNRDGQRHVVGFNQFLFPGAYLPEFMPFTYFRFGALGDFLNADGTEFDYDSWEISIGFGAELAGEVDLSVLYRLTDRDYQQTSIFSALRERRDDLQSRVTFELNKAFGDHWQVAIAGSFTFNDSDIGLYDYDRDIVGVYLTYRF
jgi:hypothetical protein